MLDKYASEKRMIPKMNDEMNVMEDKEEWEENVR